MEKYIIENQDSFNIEHIFECGQCFRWNKIDENKFLGVIKGAVIEVTQEGRKIIFTGKSNGNFKKIVDEYFDLKTDYLEYKTHLSKVDKYMKESIEFGSGIRILKQDLWECIISFIISANNNIPRIKKIIEKLSKEYGKKIELDDGKVYYEFPTPEELSKASVQNFRNLGTGFRDVRIYNTTKMILEGHVDLSKISSMETTDEMRNELLKLDGVGPKVADCILLFGLNRFDVFPIDVWVRRVMNDLYIHNETEEKVDKKEIKRLAEDKFGNLTGIAQQYLFYWKREENKGA